MNAVADDVIPDRSLSQWWTPPELADRIARWAIPSAGHQLIESITVLEPSAGTGSLVRAIYDCAPNATVLAFDVDPRCVESLRALRDRLRTERIVVGSANLAEDYDEMPHAHLVVQNPPFESGQTERHIIAAHRLAPVVVTHCPLTTLAGQRRKAELWGRYSPVGIVIHSRRPRYEGPVDGHSATDMCTIITRARSERALAPETMSELEWW